MGCFLTFYFSSLLLSIYCPNSLWFLHHVHICPRHTCCFLCRYDIMNLQYTEANRYDYGLRWNLALKGSWTSMITKSKWTRVEIDAVCMQWALLKGSNQGKPIWAMHSWTQCPWATSCLCISEENYIFSLTRKGVLGLLFLLCLAKIERQAKIGKWNRKTIGIFKTVFNCIAVGCDLKYNIESKGIWIIKLKIETEVSLEAKANDTA